MPGSSTLELFKNCYQMKLVGWSGIDDNTKAPKGFSHVHIEAWTCHHEATLTEHQKINNTVMTKFADNATYCNFVKPKYFKERKNNLLFLGQKLLFIAFSQFLPYNYFIV